MMYFYNWIDFYNMQNSDFNILLLLLSPVPWSLQRKSCRDYSGLMGISHHSLPLRGEWKTKLSLREFPTMPCVACPWSRTLCKIKVQKKIPAGMWLLSLPFCCETWPQNLIEILEWLLWIHRMTQQAGQGGFDNSQALYRSLMGARCYMRCVVGEVSQHPEILSIRALRYLSKAAASLQFGLYHPPPGPLARDTSWFCQLLPLSITV